MQARSVFFSFFFAVNLTLLSFFSVADDGQLKVLNLIKEVAYAADAALKDNGQTGVRYHHVYAAALLAVRNIYENPELFNEQFGLNVQALPSAFFEGAASRINAIESDDDGQRDRELNNAVFGDDAIKDLNAIFPTEFSDVSPEGPVAFRGEVVITNAYQRKEDLEEGDTVNVTLRLDADSTERVVNSATSMIRDSEHGEGVEIGRLTGTSDTGERHVSLGLRVRYSSELQAYVDQLNHDRSGAAYQTDGRVMFVIPPDIRTRLSVLSPLSEETTERLTLVQERINQLAPGNRLPRLHITQGNARVENRGSGLVSQFIEATGGEGENVFLESLLSQDLDIARALSEPQEVNPSEVPAEAVVRVELPTPDLEGPSLGSGVVAGSK